MHMPDTSPVFAALGAIAANYLSGPPVWLMLVSPPSSGKTQVINACFDLPYCREAGQCKNSAAFLTYDKERGLGGLLSDSRKDSTGAEVGGIGDFGILLYTEFSVILSLPPDQRDEVIGIHRQIFDGRCSRQFGGGGGRALEWKGKCGAIGAVTGAIDNNPLSGDLGERWIYYRFPPSDLNAQAYSVLNANELDHSERNDLFRNVVMGVFEEANIQRGEPRRNFVEKEAIELRLLSSVACRLRGVVRRDRYTKEITDSPQIEGAGRLTNELAGLFLGMERLGMSQKWCWKIVRKVATDCAPALRLEILRQIRHLEFVGEEITSGAITNALKVSRRTGERHLEDLEKLDVVRRVDGLWEMDGEVRKVLRRQEDDL